jgi:energy-coupling factor transporter ATP-binding protein EcfA2
MLISSHRLDEVSSLVNRVIEMDMGKVVLDDKVADDVSLSGTLACRIVIKRFEPAFAKAIAAWKFTARDEDLVWEGKVAGPRPPALSRHGFPLFGTGQRLFADRERAERCATPPAANFSAA